MPENSGDEKSAVRWCQPACIQPLSPFMTTHIREPTHLSISSGIQVNSPPNKSFYFRRTQWQELGCHDRVVKRLMDDLLVFTADRWFNKCPYGIKQSCCLARKSVTNGNSILLLQLKSSNYFISYSSLAIADLTPHFRKSHDSQSGFRALSGRVFA